LLKNLDLQLQLEVVPKVQLLDLQVFEALDYLTLRALLFDTLFQIFSFWEQLSSHNLSAQNQNKVGICKSTLDPWPFNNSSHAFTTLTPAVSLWV
jgi:hypothetical protein